MHAPDRPVEPAPADPVIVVHGGAWDIPQRWREEAAGVCRAAAALGRRLLVDGADAIDAVCAAIRHMEDAPVLDAGIGAAPDAFGDFSLDASLMRGSDRACGAVARLPPTRHPIDLARAVLEHSPHVMLAGPEALAWGAEHGVMPCPAADLALPPAYRDPPPYLDGGDTVGAVALDRRGALVAGTSTGGVPGRHPARVGDSPLIGCGTYCDPRGGAGSTGKGEAIIRMTLARAAVDAIGAGADPTAACKACVVDMLRLTGGRGGLIALDARGRVGLWHTTPAMAWAVADGTGVRGHWRVIGRGLDRGPS